jgi:hypothetical protein
VRNVRELWPIVKGSLAPVRRWQGLGMVYPGRYLTSQRTWSGSLLIRRQAAAMLVALCRRWRLKARLRNEATGGGLQVRSAVRFRTGGGLAGNNVRVGCALPADRSYSHTSSS